MVGVKNTKAFTRTQMKALVYLSDNTLPRNCSQNNNVSNTIEK